MSEWIYRPLSNVLKQKDLMREKPVEYLCWRNDLSWWQRQKLRFKWGTMSDTDKNLMLGHNEPISGLNAEDYKTTRKLFFLNRLYRKYCH
jgi:hypothetical protein